jgi:glycosyltransferase involved in cell wall biosynthesis
MDRNNKSNVGFEGSAIKSAKLALVNNDFDFRHIDGIGRYSKEVSRAIRESGINLRTISTDDLQITRSKQLKFINIPIVRERMRSDLLKYRPDILHIMKPETFIELPAISENVNVVTTWHDMKLLDGRLELRKEKGFLKTSVLERAYERAYKRSNAIAAVSSMTVDDVNSWAKERRIFDPKKSITIINPGINDGYVTSTIWEGDRKNFVYVGDLRKVLPTLLLAFSSILSKVKDSSLHIFTSTNGAEEVISNALAEIDDKNLRRVIVIHYRPKDHEILEGVRMSVALLHLSLWEGFGFTILESLAVGTPVIVLRSARIPPEVSKFAIKVDLEEIPDKCEELRIKQQGVSKEAISYARSFTYVKTAEELIRLYQSLGKMGPPTGGDTSEGR